MKPKLTKRFLTVASVVLIITMLFVATAVTVSAEGDETQATVVTVPFSIKLSQGVNMPTSYVSASKLSGYAGGGPGNTLRMNSNDDYFEVKINVTAPGTYYLSAEVARGAYSSDKKLLFEVKEIAESAIQYGILKQDHWAVASEDIGTVTFTEAGEYTIRVSDYGTQLFGAGYQNHTTFIRSITLKEKLAAPTGIVVSGTTFSNLDSSKSYAIAPYTILGADDDNAFTITGKDTVDVYDYFTDPVGLYAICFKGDDVHLSSDAGAVCYVAGDPSGRETIGNMKSVNYKGTQTEDGDGNGVLDEYDKTFSVPYGTKGTVGAPIWKLGEYTGADYYYSFDPKKLKFTDHGCFKADYMYYTKYTVNDYNAAAAYEALSEEEQAATVKPAATTAEILESVQDTYRSIKVRYAYGTDDIIPINEVISLDFGTFSRFGGAFSFSLNSAKAKYVFHVIDKTGEITEVTYISSEAVDHSTSGYAYETVTFADIEGMPTEGWLIGWEYYPFGALEASEIIAKSSSASNNRLSVTFILPNCISAKDYAIHSAKTAPFKLALSEGHNNPTSFILSSKLTGYVGGPGNTLKMNAADDYFEFKVYVTTPGTYSVFSELSMGQNGSPKTLTVEIKDVAGSAVTHKIQYAYNWGVKEEYIGELTFENKGEYTIRVSDGGSKAPGAYQQHTTYIKTISFKEKLPPITGVNVDGTTISGLDSTKSYVLAPYTVLGAEEANAVTITGKDAIDVKDYFADAVGLYGLYVPGYDIYANSNPVIVYAKGSYAQRKTLGEVWAAGDIKLDGTALAADSTWIGSVKHGSSYDNFAQGFLTHNETLYTAAPGGNMTAETHFSMAFINELYTATDKQAVVDKYKNYQNYVYRYALTDEEVIDVDELNSISFSFFGAQTNNAASVFKIVDGSLRFIAYAYDSNGNLNEYISDLYFDDLKFDGMSGNYFTVDFKDNKAWLNETAPDGYMVGYAIYPYYGFDKAENYEVTGEATGKARAIFRSASWNISLPKAEKPTGVTMTDNTLSGLTSAYTVAPFVVTGADVENALDVADYASGSYTFNPATQAGLWGVYVTATETNAASDPVIVYVRGSSAVRADLGNEITKTYSGTYNNGTPDDKTDDIAVSNDVLVYDYSKVAESTKEWSVGQLLGADPQSYVDSSDKENIRCRVYNLYKSDWVTAYNTSTSKDLYEAYVANNGTYEKLQKENADILKTISVRYAYESEEIIPVDEVIEMTFSAGLGTQYLAVNATKYVVELYVMTPDGKIEVCTYTSAERTVPGDVNLKQYYEVIDVQNDFDLPEEGWVVGYKFYPYGGVEASSITYKSQTSESTQFANRWMVPLGFFDGFYTIKEDDHAEFGMSLVLDGKIGVKVTANVDETVTGLALANVVGTDSYIDFGTNNYAIFYVDPKDVASAEITFNITYTDAEGAEVYTPQQPLTVANYVTALKESTEDASVIALIEAFETYYLAVADYFNTAVTEVEALEDLTNDERVDLLSKRYRTRTGEVSYIQFHSTSLILEDDTAIRHYFKLIDDSLADPDELAACYQITGGTAFKYATVAGGTEDIYVYTDVENIASVDLDEVQEVTIVEDGESTFTVKFNALAYVDVCLAEENVDTKLSNLVKALYRYSVESDAFAAN